MKIKYFFVLFCVSIFFLLACKTTEIKKEEKNYSFVKINWDNVTLLEERSKYENFLLAIDSNLKWLSRKKNDSNFNYGNIAFKTSDYICTINYFQEELKEKNSLEVSLVKKYFDIYKVKNKDNYNVLYTGYYIPYANASEVKTNKFNVPVYKTPADLVSVHLEDFYPDLKGKIIRGRINKNRLFPYWSREEIMEKKKLQNKELEIAWVNNKTDLFFIEIQGSGLLTFSDGSKKYIHYAQQNGREYKPIGSLLVKEGALTKENVSMQAIKKWLKDNPKEEQRILNFNKSYVFFNLENEGPYGNISVKLVSERSIAADQRYFPAGSLMLLDFPYPSTNSKKETNEKFSQLAFVHDTGGAIKGPGRIDVFWGEGEDAGEIAGKTKQNGEIYLLVPKFKCNTYYTAGDIN
ncbi:MltA domain-containing protein [Pigmentibacter sp. JX0631]|uniref:murein transglycosylase A n=1 Tax=Pigmentibacter sp. JX0631 TaxID=2976982 RepID=UPI00246920E5|nr:MltA domain-containing protein [Pigmentibacter sp. JX0631]WGL58625.1 MltA domain-containing protein [Pigmentibacter sp. JX0631]